ncbi:MAG: putative amidophosphoribosyltransferase [Bermanella sp.]|jgi:predicted amidophosphoribosyltransferase
MLNNQVYKIVIKRLTQLSGFQQKFLAPSVWQFMKQINAAFGHQHCYLCHQHSNQIVCRYCLETLLEDGFGQHLSASPDLLRNPNALKNLDTPNYDHLFAIDNYVWPIDKLVLDMKFGNKPVAAKALAMMFMRFVFWPCIERTSIAPYSPAPERACDSINAANATNGIPQLLIPVPLSNKRYWQRHYNQAQLLCDCLSIATHIPNQAIVRRVKHTLAQTELNKQQRIDNVYNAFKCDLIINAKHIAVIDDVITTGVTINAVCQAIKTRNPTIKISVWTMAITLLK